MVISIGDDSLRALSSKLHPVGKVTFCYTPTLASSFRAFQPTKVEDDVIIKAKLNLATHTDEIKADPFDR